MPGDRRNPTSALKTRLASPDNKDMDLTDTITDDNEDGSVDSLPLLPTLPPEPVLPTPQALDVNEFLATAIIAPPPPRPNPAADASYGVIPRKPRAGDPSPATLRAAEQRRQAKKRRRIKRIAMLVIAIAVCALAGPPVGRWIADGLDKAGSTETDPPPADDAAG